MILNFLKRLRYLILPILAVGVYTICGAQGTSLSLRSNGFNERIPTEYTISGKRDSIYVFKGVPSGPTNIGNLYSVAVDTANRYSFTWQKYNPLNHVYENIAGVSPLDTASSDSLKNLGEGGYRVLLTVEDSVMIEGVMYNITVLDSTRAAWIFVYNIVPSSKYQNENSEGLITDNLNNCSNVEFRVTSDYDELKHYNPTNGTEYTKQYVKYSYSLAYALFDSPQDTANLLSGVSSSAIQTIRLPNIIYDTAWFYFTTTDYFGNELTDTGIYHPVIPYPAIDTSITWVSEIVRERVTTPEDWEGYYQDQINETSSAPVEIVFYNDSCKNAIQYTWKYGDNTYNDTIDTKDSVVHVFRVPGVYITTLVVKGPNPNCIDSAQIEVKVLEVTDTSSFKFPNVFTPGIDGGGEGDGENDMFRCLDISIYDIDIKIYNRWGKLMHEYEGNIRYWTGWNGNIMDSNSRADDGVYYYALKYEYYNKKGERIKKEKSGFVHLFRETGGQ